MLFSSVKSTYYSIFDRQEIVTYTWSLKNIIQPANTRNTEIQDKNKTIDKMQLIAAILAAVHLLTALPVTTGIV